MAQSIRFDYAQMEAASAKIKALAGQYKTAGMSFVNSLTGAMAGWEGESQAALAKFIEENVKSFTSDDIPQMMDALASLLEANAKQMQEADAEIAKNIAAMI